MINPEFLRILDSVKLPEKEYAIFGSGPLAIRGIRDCRDLDVVVTDNMYKVLLKDYQETEPGKITIGEGVDIISGECSKLNDYEGAIARSEEISGHKYVTLPDIIKWKEERKREKDLHDLALIRDYLETLSGKL